jgi:hypothetical protein
MALFPRDPEKKLQRDIETARTNRDSLVERLQAAELLVSERQAAAQRLAVAGADDAALDRAEAELRKAQDRVSTLSAALDEIKQRIVALEKGEAERADQKLRAATAATLEQRAVTLEGAAAGLDVAFAAFVTATAEAAIDCLDGKGLSIFAQSAKADLGPAVQVVARELRARAAATIAGTAPATLSKEPPALVEPPAPMPRQTYFTVQLGMYLDATGALCRVPRCTFVELTSEQVQRALRLGGVCAKDDPRIPELRRKVADQQPPEPHLCQNWDTGELPVGDPGLLAHRSSTGSGHTVFERVDRGPAYSVKAPPAAPAVAARNEDADHD